MLRRLISLTGWNRCDFIVTETRVPAAQSAQKACLKQACQTSTAAAHAGSWRSSLCSASVSPSFRPGLGPCFVAMADNPSYVRKQGLTMPVQSLLCGGFVVCLYSWPSEQACHGRMPVHVLFMCAAC